MPTAKEKDKTRLSLNTDYKGSALGDKYIAPIRNIRGLQTDTLLSGRAMDSISRMKMENGAGNVPGCFVQQKTFLHNLYPALCYPDVGKRYNVFTPRERDTQKNEVIVDNDTKTVLSIWK